MTILVRSYIVTLYQLTGDQARCQQWECIGESLQLNHELQTLPIYRWDGEWVVVVNWQRLVSLAAAWGVVLKDALFFADRGVSFYLMTINFIWSLQYNVSCFVICDYFYCQYMLIDATCLIESLRSESYQTWTLVTAPDNNHSINQRAECLTVTEATIFHR